MTGLGFYQDIWHPAALVVSNQERNGIRLDVGACERELEALRARRETLEISLRDWAGQEINWGSWQQLRQFLYGTTVSPATQGGEPIIPLGLDVPPVSGTLRAVKATRQGEEPTSEAALWHLSDHADDLENRVGIRLLLQWKKLRRMESFFASLPFHAEVDGRVHCDLAPGTETGRLTSRNPNLQQQPNDYEDPTEQVWPGTRLAFIADDGYVLVVRDYDGLEWRILAHVLAYKYGDTSLVEEIVAGVDPHSATAVKMGLCPGPVELVKEHHKKDRDAGKILNYCVSEDTLALTPTGWAHHSTLRVGDTVMGREGWTTVRAVHRYADTELVDVWGFRVTTNHRWWAERRTTRGGERGWFPEFVETAHFTADHRARLSVPQKLKDRSGLTPDEAALVGWIVTDGHVGKQDVSVFQKKPEYVAVLDALFEGVPHSRYERPTGVVQWRLRADAATRYRRICETVGEDFVLRLGTEQRGRFVEAVWFAEGRTKGWNGGSRRITQNVGPVADAIRLALFLEGYFVSESEAVLRSGSRHATFNAGRPYRTLQRKTPTPAGRGMSWCVTTDDGTFVIRRGNRIALTGNSINYGKTAHGLGIQIRDDNGDPIGKDRGQELLDGFYAARPGVARFHADIVEYARSRGFVRSLLGRRRYIDFRFSKAKRQAMNVIQNCAADVMTMAMLRTNPDPSVGQHNEALRKMGARQLLNVHDELVFEVPEQHAEEANEIIDYEMSNALKGVREFCCPLSTSGGIGPNWGEAK